nr:PC-esterase domain-containing protein 1A isoform X2 [Doryrhamphus excisus]
MSFEQDCLVEGGCLGLLHNGTGYREVRQYQSAHHLVRFYFVTRIFSDYMKSILKDFRHGLKPDLVIVNSCVWDISRYGLKWGENYKENLNRFFEELNGILPKESLVIWNLTMPLAETIKGGFLVPEISDRAAHLRHDVIEANFYSGAVANAYKVDVLDLHFNFRFSLHHRTKDGVHWNALAHRRITTLLTLHVANAWGVKLPLDSNARIPAAYQVPAQQIVQRHEVRHPRNNFYPNPAPVGGFMNTVANPQPHWYEDEAFHESHFNYNPLPYGYSRHPEPSNTYCAACYDWTRPHVMRNRYIRHHYTPYTYHRPGQQFSNDYF